MTKPLIKDLEIGMRITGEVFLLAESSVAETKAGAPYLKATLADRTGRIEARYWDMPTQTAEQLEVGSGVRVDGIVDEWPPDCGQRQVRIDRLVGVEILNLEDFLPVAKRDLAEMRQELQQVCAGIENLHLSHLLDHMFSDEGFAARFSKAPAAKKYHHACIGGLLEHTLAVVRLCYFVADQHPEIHRDLLLTAAILHDVGKATSYTVGPVLDLTDEGRLVDHVAQGALVVQTAIDNIEGFPQDLRNRLLHAILAHHGARERGSPVEHPRRWRPWHCTTPTGSMARSVAFSTLSKANPSLRMGGPRSPVCSGRGSTQARESPPRNPATRKSSPSRALPTVRWSARSRPDPTGAC